MAVIASVIISRRNLTASSMATFSALLAGGELSLLAPSRGRLFKIFLDAYMADWRKREG